MKVLFLAAWYPTPRDAMAGLFVQKHTDALRRQGADVRVLYYESTGIRWLRDMWQGWRQLHKEWGLPDVVQMNVLDKNGLLALYLKHHYHIPYFIIEHWSGYLPANFAFRGGWHGLLMRHIAKQANAIMPVSNVLKNAMQTCGIENAHWQKINNVVDDFFYQPYIKEPRTKKRLLHVSCFDDKAKNVKGLLRAIRKVAEGRQDFELVLIGTGIDYEDIKLYARDLHFPNSMITFTGELPPDKVCWWMQQSDAFVLFSRYETFSVVLAECLAVGLPIVTSRVNGIAESLGADFGTVVDVEDELALSMAVNDMLDHYQDYNTPQIREYGTQYSFETVGRQLIEIYQSRLSQ
ncbi:MAG: glycosyltransferase family 4 protein [Paludibacteraceae bacterium]